jgi:hypothetical protein
VAAGCGMYILGYEFKVRLVDFRHGFGRGHQAKRLFQDGFRRH